MEGLHPAEADRRRGRRQIIARFLAALVCVWWWAGTSFAQISAPVAPPPAPPIVTQSAGTSSQAATASGGSLYSIGDPTNQEQFYLELINRARANAPAEGVRLATTTDPNVIGAYNSFGVNLILMQTQ